MKRPLFSCVIPVKGPRPFFDEALVSLRAQGMDEELEIIVQDADEALTQRSGEAEKQGCLDGVRWFRESDRGQSDALNRGFSKANGEWLFWLNADDVLLPGVLKKVIDLAGRVERAEWVAGNMMYIDGSGNVMRCLRDRGKIGCYIGRPVRVFGPSSFFRRELFARSGGFDVSLRYCMDTDLWCRFRDDGVWYEKLDSYAWGFRLHSASTTMGEKSQEEQSRQDDEVNGMHKRRNVRFSAFDALKFRFGRICDGSYPMSVFDTVRYRGKHYTDCV